MNHNCTKYASTKQEKSVAKDLKGKTVIASGSLWGSKGDVRTDELLVECKTTAKTFYSFSLNVWNKIKTEAIKDGLRLPVMCIDLENGKCRKAVFENDMFNFPVYFIVSKVSKYNSFRVTNKDGTILLSGVEDIKITVIDWSFFLLLLEERKGD